MRAPVSPAILATQTPPVMQARRWAQALKTPADKPLIALSQAAPMEPPPEGLRQAMADALLSAPSTHIYGPALGAEPLRQTVADHWARDYGGDVSGENVAITAGCNLAFAATINTIAGPGDEVIVPVPWYFNHKMWLDMASVNTVPLATGTRLLPDPERAQKLITNKTKAIVLVSPNNPAGVEYPAPLIEAFFDLAQRNGLALIIDETYRDFGSRPPGDTAWPHQLFERADCFETFIQLYSFSKAYRMTGHRLGAIVASPERLAQIEKFLDTVQICAPQVAQVGALWGMENLADWLAAERLEVRKRHQRVLDGFSKLPGWRVAASGAYFAYVEHAFDISAEDAAKELVTKAGLLTLPGSMFAPTQDASAQRYLRFAFANASLRTLDEVFDRLSRLGL
ncbi:MAG: aminotransferase [Pseudomonadota bacterium]